MVGGQRDAEFGGFLVLDYVAELLLELLLDLRLVEDLLALGDVFLCEDDALQILEGGLVVAAEDLLDEGQADLGGHVEVRHDVAELLETGELLVLIQDGILLARDCSKQPLRQ